MREAEVEEHGSGRATTQTDVAVRVKAPATRRRRRARRSTASVCLLVRLREGLIRSFTKGYGCKLLVSYRTYERMTDAIASEKQIRRGSRAKEITLVQSMNLK